ncbi:MAG: endolytic transglycosylase MltG, partial [Microgenomates group bacterium]
NLKFKIENLKFYDWWPQISKEDLEIDSPYNTYKYKDLPPTPICNPGLAAIKAVLNPTPTDYWYYLSDKDGNIHFAKTLEEHRQNIVKYLK